MRLTDLHAESRWAQGITDPSGAMEDYSDSIEESIRADLERVDMSDPLREPLKFGISDADRVYRPLADYDRPLMMALADAARKIRASDLNGVYEDNLERLAQMARRGWLKPVSAYAADGYVLTILGAQQARDRKVWRES